MTKQRLRKHEALALVNQAVTTRLQRAITATALHHTGHNVVCVPCTCSSAACFRALKLETLQRNGVSACKCPAHNHDSGTFSSLAMAFTAAAKKGLADGALIWEWHCIPDKHHMSVDVCILSGFRCTLFELDGSVHFPDGLHDRQRSDEDKDAQLNKHGISLLRLHYLDVGQWVEYIERFKRSNAAKVQYSGSYVHCLDGLHNAKDIVKIGLL